MTLKPYSQRLIDYFYKSGMCCGITPGSTWFSMHGCFVSVNRISYKLWEVCYMSHTYRFYSQSEMIEWIEDQRRYGK
nr:MAG TPA: hypothetical protein [Caudoviricetes sp.]